MSLYINILKEINKKNWEPDKSFYISQQLNSIAVAQYMDYFGQPIDINELSNDTRAAVLTNSTFAYKLDVSDKAKECLNNAVDSYLEEYGEKSDMYIDSVNFKKNINDLEENENVRYIVYFE